MSKLSEYLEKKQNETLYNSKDEVAFYNENSHLIPTSPMFKAYKRAKSPFEIARANIVIRGLINKISVENELFKEYSFFKSRNASVGQVIKNLKDKIEDHPCFIDKDGNKIYIPFFAPHLNEIYCSRLDLLLRDPYKKLRRNFIASCIDPFDTYGPALFDSEFSRLIKIYSSETIWSFYDYDSEMIYFVDEQGRKENSFALFDKGLIEKDRTNLPGRLLNVSKAYVKGNREDVIRALIDNRLISAKALQEFINKEDKELDYEQ